MKLVKSDGGRSKYFRASNVGDCVVRAICNASERDYKSVYDAINALAKSERRGTRKRGVSSARDGVYKNTIKKCIEENLGFKWVSCMSIGSGCKVHLRADELPKGDLIVQVAKHLTCVRDGVLYDTYDCSAGGTRCVYGYWYNPYLPVARKLWEHVYGYTPTRKELSMAGCMEQHGLDVLGGKKCVWIWDNLGNKGVIDLDGNIYSEEMVNSVLH